jgi:hypothetical protein
VGFADASSWTRRSPYSSGSLYSSGPPSSSSPSLSDGAFPLRRSRARTLLRPPMHQCSSRRRYPRNQPRGLGLAHSLKCSWLSNGAFLGLFSLKNIFLTHRSRIRRTTPSMLRNLATSPVGLTTVPFAASILDDSRTGTPP